MQRPRSAAHRNRSSGTTPEDLAGPERLDEVRHVRLARQHLLAVDDHARPGHQPGAERHHQRLHAQQRDADAVDEPDHQPERQPDGDRREVARARRWWPADRRRRWRRWRPRGRCRRSASPASGRPPGCRAAPRTAACSTAQVGVDGAGPRDLDAGDEERAAAGSARRWCCGAGRTARPEAPGAARWPSRARSFAALQHGRRSRRS